MRINGVELENFASYKSLEFDYSDQGLTLLKGATGSGKSTLCDAVPWIIYGCTAKGGAVNEVLSWPGDQVTKGKLVFSVGEYPTVIVRTRGPKPKDNDLYYVENGTERRGKDIPDTQRLINQFLGADADLYLAGAYYHEFSQTAQFFTTTAKNRRAMCEQMVDLTLATKLQPRLADSRKLLVQQESKLENDIYKLRTNIDLLKRSFTAETVKHGDWEVNKIKKLAILKEKYDSFEKDKLDAVEYLIEQDKTWVNQQQTDNKSTMCRHCGSVKKAKPVQVDSKSPYADQIDKELARPNTYLTQYNELEAETNPYDGTAKSIALDQQAKELELEETNELVLQLKLDLDDVSALSDVVADFRSATIQNTIQTLESSTNQLLTDHFDAEIRVLFAAGDADKIDIEIFKDGNLCVFTQLSKGQRQLLRLCFAISCMQTIQNHHGVKFEQLFLDEALDGLDSVLKVKAFGLLQAIAQSYDSVFVVEHSQELKDLFDTQYQVQLVNGESVIEKS